MSENKRPHLDEETVLLLNKGRRGLLRLIFGRTAVIILLLAVQAALLFVGFFRLGKYVVYGSSMLAALVVILAVVNRRGNPAAKITWILLIMLAPVFAIPFYFYVDMDLGHHLVRRRLEQVQARTARYAPPQLDALSSLWERSPGLARIARYVEHTSGQSFYQRSGVRYLPTGEAVFEEMLRQLEQAEKFIFLEFFIVEEGYMWGRILRVLERKVQEGVEVRMLYDGTCAVGKLPYRYPRELEALGIRCRMFAPLHPPGLHPLQQPGPPEDPGGGRPDGLHRRGESGGRVHQPQGPPRPLEGHRRAGDRGGGAGLHPHVPTDVGRGGAGGGGLLPLPGRIRAGGGGRLGDALRRQPL